MTRVEKVIPSQVFLSRRKLWTIRLALLGICVLWFSLGFYLHHQAKVSRAKVAQSRIEEARRQEFLRREAQYKQDVQQRTHTPRVRNVFDGR